MSKAMDRLFRGIQIVIAFFLAVMIILVFLNVVLRYLFSTGFAWSEEVARLAFIYLVYLGTIDAYRDNRHLGVEMLVVRVRPAVQKLLYLAIQGIVIWMMALLTWGSFTLARQSLNDRWVATQFPVYLVHGVGIVTGVAIILLAASNIIKMFTSDIPVPELMAPKDDADTELVIE
ncbi:MAG: TRAP transporter small permease [Brooklawnia sp.]|jgi:TRAP-type C4-dicarboxylate transport system permease small subunit